MSSTTSSALDAAALPHDRIFEATGEGLLILDVDGVVHHANAFALGLLNREIEDVRGRTVSDLLAVPIPGDDPDAALRMILRSVGGPDEPEHLIVGVPQATGRPLPIDVTLTALGEGLLVAVIRDAMDRLRNEKELRLYKRAVDFTSEAILYTCRKGLIRTVNRAFVDLTGYELEEVEGRTPRVLKSGEHSDEFYADMWGSIANGGRWRGDLVNRRKDGTTYLANLTISPIVRDDGSVQGYVGIQEDVTRKRAAERELAEAKEAAVAAGRAKSDFLANMSHEIRTPMNAIIGMTELLGDTRLDVEQREFVDTVSTSADSLLRLINDILDFSKIEARKLEIEEVEFDLARLVDQVAGMGARKAHQKRIELACMVYANVPPLVRGDPTRVRQVLLNLLTNAIKFTGEGEVVLRARVAEPGEDRVRVRFEVQDTGIGIPSDRASTVFDPFTQVDASTTRKYGGTGLGLAIVKQLVELMGGEIGVDTIEGQGSTFWFELPFDVEHGSPAERRAPRVDVRGLRVLVVDDNATNRRIVETHLSSWGCDAESCADAETALRRARDAAAAGQPFDVGVIDFQMPGMDGAELGRHLKSDPATATTELIMLTSMTRGGERERMEQAGFRKCLSKPVTRRSLLRAFEEAAALIRHTELKRSSMVGRKSVVDGDLVGGRVLLVEDNPVNRRVACRMLQKLGFEYETAEDGAQALKILASSGFDLIISDVQMPVMDGLALAAAIREREPEGVHVPIIAMTAHAMQGDREKCLAAGMDGYVAKPVRIAALKEAIDTWLRPVSPQGGEWIDEDALMAAADGDVDFARELLEMFLGEAAARIDELAQAVDDGDGGVLRRAGHRLKGGAACLGAEPLRAHAESLELMGAADDLSGAADVIEHLRRDFEQAKGALARRS